jgi:UDP-glucose 4-epimerase
LKIEIRNKKILVTGGAGFIGSELVRQLAFAGAEVVVIDNLANGRVENLAGLPTDRVNLVVADVRDDQKVEGLIRGMEIVFHLACLGVRHSIHSPQENHDVNSTATLQLLMAARSAGVSRFVYVSSSEVYGSARKVPMSEEHPTYPMTVYGASKLAGECYTRAFYQTYGFPTVVVRPFNTFGPRSHHEGDSGEVIPKFMLRCMAGLPMIIFGDGSNTRDFTYVSDTANGILQAAFSDGVLGETINLGSGSEISLSHLAQEISQILGKPNAPVVYDQPRPGDVKRLYADTRKARRLLDYIPQLTLTDGLIQLREWYLNLGQPPRRLLEQEIVHNWELNREDKHA